MNQCIQIGSLQMSYEQSGRVYSEEGICPTVMGNSHGKTSGGYNSPKILVSSKKECNMNDLIKLGNVYPSEGQAGWIYDSNGISPTLVTFTGGGGKQPIILERENNNTKTIHILKEVSIDMDFVTRKYQEFINRNGYFPKMFSPYNGAEIIDYAPTISTQSGTVGHIGNMLTIEQKSIINNDNNIKRKDVINMYKNIMEKLNFKMEEIKLFDSFAGIGALHQSLKELGVPTKIVGMSEIEVDAIISYASGHIENFKDLSFEYPSDDEMKKLLMDRNIGYDYAKQKSSIPKIRKDKLKYCYKACIIMNNLGDISMLDYKNIPDFDLFNMSFPCTDISNAGKQAGMTKDDGSITRSGLYIYGMEVIKAKTPKYIMVENVKGLIQKKFIDDFYGIVKEIEELGYNCYYPKKKDGKATCLNAKNYGIPQNRERIFIICVRKDVDKNNTFNFPIGKDYGIRLKDLLEESVNEKYYLSQEIQDRFKLNGKENIEHNELNVVGSSAPDFRTIGQRDITYGVNGIMSTLTATDYKQPKQILDDNCLKFVGGINSEETNKWIDDGKDLSRNYKEGYRVYDSEGIASCQKNNGGGLGSNTGLYLEDTNNINVIGSTLAEGVESFAVMNRVYGDDGISPTIDTMQGGNRQPKILATDHFIDKKGRTQEFRETENYIQWDTSGKGYNSQVDRTFYENGNVGTIPAMNPQDKTQVIEGVNTEFRIRKLTPKECWRLMGFRDEHIDKAKELGMSDSSLYKQAGNSIVVNVLYFIFKELFKDNIIN
jgi:DNA (cytosine-5)-methyltransferase 1